MRTKHRLGIALVVAALCACVSLDLSNAKIEWSALPASAARAMQLEDARSTNDGELVRMLENNDVGQRICVTHALGRMPFPEEGAEVTRALLRALADANPAVRTEAAFALGMRGDPSAADKLLFVALDHHEADTDAAVRARAIEAASKLDRPELRERVLDGLLDADANVRLEAAEGASRWPTSEANASAINQRLVDSLANEKERDVIVYTLFALERRKAIEALDVFVHFAATGDDDQRLFAVRGLKSLAPDARVLEPLLATARAPSADVPTVPEEWWIAIDARRHWREHCEAALGLGASAGGEAIKTLAALTKHDNAHVRRCAWEAIGALAEREKGAPALLQHAGVELNAVAASPSDETSTSVRGARLEARLRALKQVNASGGAVDEALDALAPIYSRLSPVERIGFLRGVAALDEQRAVNVLLECVKDPDFAVGETAIEMLPRFPTAQVRKALQTIVGFEDNGLRLAVVTALAEMPDASDVEPLKRCYESSTGDGVNEIRFNVLRNVAKLGADSARKLLSLGALDDNAFVRRVARDEAKKLGVTSPQLEQSLAYRSAAEKARLSQPLGLETMPVSPVVEIVTSRGTMTFNLIPAEAPLHVQNFLALAARDYYDGLTFHRVVPDFVIQGGDYRGDGNGGGTWRGRDDALRHEITPRKFVRGSLGMPRNDDIDSGGSQFFVTHRPTPHLDGRYTIFGELKDGFDVLDAIEVGDTIVDVRMLNGVAKR